ncbi:MAG: 6-carboxytetrahydropterin synthase QueD [Acidobacteria bacterium]|nr:MAG: 6-carboxytetrahydropterin synthase QueD [Acidobacteriota bacterium]
MKLGVVEHMDCAHFLPGHNRCGNPHGHTYRVELVIEGENRSGMILDFADLKKAARDVLGVYDHRSLNDFLDYPSVENLCELLRRDLSQRLRFPFIVRVWEGEGKWAEL